MWKECDVVMLPATNLVNIGDYVLSKLKDNTLKYGRKDSEHYNYFEEKQHLYILSSDKIEKGDWCIYQNKFKNTPIICQAYKHKDDKRMLFDDGSHNRTIGEGITPLKVDCKKIIATTDKSIKRRIYEGFSSYERPYPEPSTKFIKKYCELGGIDKVLVEYQTRKEFENEEDATYGTIHELKVSTDNTITIKPIKDNYSREEVEQLCKYAWHVGYSVGNNDEMSPSHLTAKDFIKNNL